ncbi:MAG: translation initiation factor IF-2 [Candidatus Moranbacteria bacterium]|nr:translation initiation factor IF-2 [Candidatus Moranbacteria bacterium]
MTQETTEKTPVKIPSTVTVKRFSDLLGVPVSSVIKELMNNKILATINEEIDFDTASVIADDLGFLAEADLTVSENEMMTLEKLLELCTKERDSGDHLQPRPPVVTILGHVDHGKTTLLDTIRRSSVAAGEAGGITQHISAYQVKKRGKLITFVDTPGHEAFAAMRERGVSIADIAILVVSADDGVRPQTKEVISYLTSRKVPTIVAINKIDKPEANVARVKQELAEHEVLIEEWGGKIVCNEISAKNNIGVSELLESILLVTDVEDFRANSSRDGLAVVLESHLDPQKGPVSTVLVKTGSLKVGQDVIVGKTYGRVRRMEDSAGRSLEFAGPSTPVTLLGLAETTNTNDVVQVATQKTSARLQSQERSQKAAGAKTKTIDDESVLKLPIVLKSDVQGSLEAIDQIFSSFPAEKVHIDYIATGVGNITESDVRIAQSADALVLGFNVPATPVAGRLAEEHGVTIETYKVIYELVDRVQKKLLDLLPTTFARTDIGSLEVLAVFLTEKKRMIVGGRVIDGVAKPKVKIDVYRGENMIGTGEISNLQSNKVNVDEVKKNQECGVTFDGETKIKVGDTLKFYTEEEEKKEL